MRTEDMIMISVDDHLVEPPDMFDDVIPAKYKDRAPKVVHTDEGNDVWTFGDAVIPNVGLNAVAGRPKEEYGVDPTAFDEMRPGCFDVHERVKDMNAGGVLACMNFPSFPGFAGRLFAIEDRDFGLALLRAYNDWHVDEWCGAYPARFIPMCLPVIWDAEACAAEVRRNADRGVHALTFSENPSVLGYPSFHDDYWTPLWKALVDTETVMNVHIGSSGKLAVTAPDAPMDTTASDPSNDPIEPATAPTTKIAVYHARPISVSSSQPARSRPIALETRCDTLPCINGAVKMRHHCPCSNTSARPMPPSATSVSSDGVPGASGDA